MAFSRKNYDEQCYEQYQKDTTFQGNYALNEPRFFNQAPLLDSVYIRTGKYGHVTKDFTERINLESDIQGYTRPSVRECKNQHLPNQNMKQIDNYTLVEFNVVETRLDNPGCTLRGTGFNRWDWVHMDPQKNVMVPFDFMVDTKQLAKDNHRPHIVRPEYQNIDSKKMSNVKTQQEQFYGRGLVR